MGSESIRSCSLEQLEQLVAELGQPRFRAKQIHEWLHVHNVSSYDDMTNVPKALRERLRERFPLQGINVIKVDKACDGTRKYLLELGDKAVVECVGILGKGADDEKEDLCSVLETRKPCAEKGEEADETHENPKDRRLTVCCSTQVGCSMGCSFCATGQQGLERNLSSDEIVEQIVAVRNDFKQRVNNVVVMGQGEPFQNYDATIEAMRRMNTDEGLGIGARRITVSTSGICDGIKRLAGEPEQFRLAVSLHSADQKTRNELMPRLSGQNLKKLRSALEFYCETKRRRITLEYMLLRDVNDSEPDMRKLEDFCKGLNVHVNILPFNAVEGIEYESSGWKTAGKWVNWLEDVGIPCSVRKSKGSDIAGACGQLKADSAVQ